MATKVLVLRVGETKILKRKIRVLSVAKDPNVGLTTSCSALDLSNTEDLVCYGVDYALDFNSLAAPWDNGDVHFTGVGFLDQKYSADIIAEDGPGITTFIQNISPGLFSYVNVIYSTNMSTGNRHSYRIIVKGPQSVVQNFYATFKTVNFGETRIYASPCTATTECCPVGSAS